ncbi:MAG: hypothetical protein ACOWWR_07395 [Eubacteriales bacterium]
MKERGVEIYVYNVNCSVGFYGFVYYTRGDEHFDWDSSQYAGKNDFRGKSVGTLGFFEFAKIGIPICIIALVYMYFIGYRLLPNTTQDLGDVNSDNEIVEMSKNRQIISSSVFLLVVIGIHEIRGVFWTIVKRVDTKKSIVNEHLCFQSSKHACCFGMNVVQMIEVQHFFFVRGNISVCGVSTF